MWLLFTAGFRRWLLLTVALPLAGGLARRLAAALEKHQGSSPVSRALVKAANVAQRSTGKKPQRRRTLLHPVRGKLA